MNEKDEYLFRRTYERLIEFIELSMFRKDNIKFNLLLDEYALSMNVGRGAGHSTAIAKVITNQLYVCHIFLIVENHMMKGFYMDHFKGSLMPKNVSMFTQQEVVKGVMRGLDTTDSIFIMDLYRIDQQTLQVLYESLMHRKPAAIVRVGASAF